jgi:hypothetical protein
MTRRVIGKGVLAAGLGALLLAGAGGWDSAEADRRGHRGRHHHGHHHHHHHGFHGRHFHSSFFFGPRVFVGPRVYPYYYGGYYVAPPPPVVVTPPPTTYVERPPASGYWHYCQDPAGYYPDVQQCPGGWIQVAPR